MIKKILFFLAVLINFVLSAQNSIPYYYHLSKQNGMPTEVVYDVYQDRKGFIWLSTEQGLFRYDGKNYQNYALDEQTSKSGSCISEDKYGRIWYSNFDGYLYFIEKGQLKLFKPHIPIGYLKFGLINNSLFTVEEEGVIVYDLETGKKKKSYPINQKKLNFTHSDGKNFYVFADELLIINEKGKTAVQLPEALKNFRAGIMQNTKNGLLFTSKHESFGYFFKNNTFSKVNLPKEITFVQNTSFDGKENWLCTTDGAFSTNLSQPFFKGYNISTVYKDRNQNYWFATINNGIFLVPNLHVQFFESKNIITSLSAYKNQLLIGTQNEELFLKNIENQNEKLIFKGENKHEIYLLKSFNNSPNIFTSSYGFRILDQNGKLVYQDEAAIKDIDPLDEKNFAFAASGTCGFLSFGKTKTDWKKIFPPQITLGTQNTLINKVRGKSVVFDAENLRLYFATNKGLFVVSKNKTQEILYRGKSVYISRLVQYGSRIFALTQNNKLLQVKDFKIIQPSVFQSLSQNKILNIRMINERLYLNSDNGIFVYDFKTRKEYKKLSYNQDFEFSQITEIGDKVFIGVNRGILSLPLSYQEHQNYPKLILDEVKVNGKITSFSSQKSFENDENNLELKYALLNFTPGEKYKVFYKINNGNWHLADENSRKLDFPSLSAGDYQITLKTEDKNASPIVLNFTIKQVFWKSWIFILFVGGLLIFLIIFYYRYQIRKINYTKQLEIDTIRLEKESNSSKLKAFKSQMNPHFFYNALNTLQSYILTNEKKPALTYLSQFSGLTRKILEFTEQDYISLEEEIETLKLYLELEKARFNGDLHYEISTKNMDHLSKIHIPVLLLQPYVENAIKHGLLHSRKEKILNISFEKKKDFLCIRIEDNGIGVEKSKIINAQKGNQKPASFATSAQEKRVEILNKMYKNSVSIIIENKENENGVSTGTLVKIQLKPINVI